MNDVNVRCKCHNHDAFKEYSDSDRLYKTTSHDFSIKELQWLKENGHFSKGSYVCAGYLAYARTHLKPKLQKNPSDDNGTSSSSCSNVAEEIISEQIQKTIELINDGNISQFEREKVFEALGKSMNLDIYRDLINLKHSNMNMEKTTEIDSHTYLMSFHRPLVKLLVGMADILLNSTTSPKKMHALCLAVDHQIDYTRNLTFIGPFSFSTSLVK